MHRIVGLDVSQDEVRAAILSGGFRGASLEDVREARLPPEGTPAERLAAGLAALALTPPIGPEDAIAVALPGAMVAAHLVTLPFVDPKRIEQVLPAEVEGIIPFDLADVVWDYSILSAANGKTEILVGVVQKNVLREELARFSAAGIDPRVVTLGPFALAALVEKGSLTAPEGISAVLLDTGPGRADLVLAQDGKVSLARALATLGPDAWASAASDEGAISRIAGFIARDVKISLRARNMTPSKILLAGPIAAMPGAAEKLSSDLQLPAEPLTLPAGGPAAAQALGLALRAQTPRGKINFRKDEFAFTRDLSQVRGQITRVAAAVTVLLVLSLVYGVARLSSLHAQAEGYDDAVCAATKRILGACTTDYRQAIGRLSGGSSRAAGIPRVSAADVLAEVITHLPPDAPPLIQDLETTTTAVRIKGAVGGYDKVDAITSGLKKDKCFGEIKPPRSEKARDANGIVFSAEFPYTCSGESPGGA
ncbi:MAG TPA: pilus assembly protein PilM [Myxococcales bacterium]|jgi:general secretion pathway protein L